MVRVSEAHLRFGAMLGISSANAYARGTHSSIGPPWTSRLYGCKQTCFDSSAWFSMAVKLVGHLQMVGFNVVLLRPKGGNPLETLLPIWPVFTCKQKATEITLCMIWVYKLNGCMYAWLPQVRMINVAVILVLFLCFEWMCAWPHTSGKVRPLPTTQYTSCHLPHRCSGLPHSNRAAPIGRA